MARRALKCRRDEARPAGYYTYMSLSPSPADQTALDCYFPVRQTTPVVVASPHSGSLYPAPFLAIAAVPLTALRRAEDAFVDELFRAAPTLGDRKTHV